MTVQLSYSRSNLYTHCKFAFKMRYIDKLPERRSEALEGGSLFHEWAEEYVKHLIDTNRQTDYEKAREIAGRSSGAIPYDVYTDIHKVFNNWFEDFFLTDQANAVYAERMLSFNSDWEPSDWRSEDTFLRMKIDRIEIYPHEIVIEDYKTSRAIPKVNDLQLNTYALGIRLETPDIDLPIRVQENFVRFGYIRESVLGYDDYKDVGEHYMSLAADIERNTVWDPTPSSWCDFCGYKSKCPRYQADVAGTVMDVQTPAQAVALAEHLYLIKTWSKDAAAILQAYEEEFGRIVFSDMEYSQKLFHTPSFNNPEPLWEELKAMGVLKATIMGNTSMTKTDVKRCLKDIGLKGKKSDGQVAKLADKHATFSDSQRFAFKKTEGDDIDGY